MPRKYTGNTDGNYGGPRPGTLELLRLASKRGFTNKGHYANRRMNNFQAAADPTNPKFLSVHATGRAIDLGYTNRAAAMAFWEFLLLNTRQLGIEAIHDYHYRNPAQSPKDRRAWGRGYRCSRGEGVDGVKIFTASDNAGSPGARHIHVELSPAMADNPAKFRAAWVKARARTGYK